ncbi:MAG: GNAT family N-acetyltransferase [Litorilinea sp.]
MSTLDFASRTCKLRNGDDLRIERFTPYPGAPLDLIRAIYDMALQVHGGLTHWVPLADSLYVSRSLAGSFVETGLDLYFTGWVDDRIVGHVGYQTAVDAPHLGSLGWVYTEPNYRGLGISSYLTGYALEHFQAAGGRCMQLGTSNPIANRLYAKHGFFDYHGHVMRWLREGEDAENFDAGLFANTGPATVRDVVWGDATKVAMLYAAPHAWFSKDYGEHLFAMPPRRYFSVFTSLMIHMEQKQGAILVLESPRKIVVGAANLLPVDPLVQRHTANFDFLVRPAYRGQARDLLDAAIRKAGEMPVEILWLNVAACDTEKKSMARAAGFQQVATKTGQLRVGTRTEDLELYRLAL